MKQTIKYFELTEAFGDISLTVEHSPSSVEITIKDNDETIENIDIDLELIDSLIAMLQKRKELMG